MEKIFDFESPNFWSSHIELIMNNYIDDIVIQELREISTNDNKYIEIEDIYELTSKNIFNDVLEFTKENTCYIKLYHGTAIKNIESFLEYGLLVLSSDEKNKYIRELFNQKEFPELTDDILNNEIEKHLDFLGMKVRENRISFMTNKKHLLQNETHYLVYGSEYVFILAQRLGYEYKKFLEDNLKSTILTCKVPLKLLNDDFIEIVIKNIIVKSHLQIPTKAANLIF